MATGGLPDTTTQVRQQYESFPYPYREVEEESKRMLSTALDDLTSINHYCYRGRRDFTKGFRVLVAGGGTGDASVYLADQLRDTDAAIIHLDLSEASIAVARQRAQAHGLEDRIIWRRGSLLDLPHSGLEPFDYINCCGVLHHLEDSRQGLAALRSVLKDDGGMALLLYARAGRTAVYLMQELMRTINHNVSDLAAKVANTRKMLAALPETHYLTPNIHRLTSDELTDTEIVDMFLHVQDRSFVVTEVHELLAEAGLNLAEFTVGNRPLYDPRHAISDPDLLAEVLKLPKPAQQAAAELYWTTVTKHVFWASTDANSTADPAYPENVPQWTPFARRNGARESILAETSGAWTLGIHRPDGIHFKYELSLDGLTRRLLELIDDRRTIGEIVRASTSDDRVSTDSERVWKTWLKLFAFLQSYDLVLLRHVSVPHLGRTVSRAA